MTRKKTIIALLVTLSVLFGTGPAAFAKVWKLRSADVVAIASPYTVGMNMFADKVKAGTDGAVQITHFPAGQLGSDTAIAEGVKLGNIDLAVVGTIGSKVAEVFYLPFLFKDAEHQKKVINGPIGRKISARLEAETGLKLLGMFYFAPRQLTVNKAVRTPADAKGLKIRVPMLPPMVQTWKALGASPTPIAFTELFTALQQGVVDAQENPFQIIHDSSFYEVQKYVIETNHCIPVRFLIVNRELWAELDPAQQEVMTAAYRDVGAFIEKTYLEKDEAYKTMLLEKGMQILQPDVQAFRDATADVWKEFAPEAWGEGVYEEIQKLR